MRFRSLAALTVVALSMTSTLSAQLRPASRWALGLGFTHMTGSGAFSASGSGVGVTGTWAPMLTNTLGLEVEGRAVAATGSEADPLCAPVPGAICEAQMLVPSEVVGLDARMAWVPDPRLRLSAGPSVAWAPNATGPGSEQSLGASFGVGMSPFDRYGRGVALELRGTRFFSSLGEIDWVLGTALSYRF